MKEFVEVVFPLPLEKPLYYKIPPCHKDKVREGVRVILNLKERKMTGIVVKVLDKIPNEFIKECKEIEEVIDENPILSKAVLELTRRLSEYYLVPWGEFIKLSLPPSLILKTISRIFLTEKAKNKKYVSSLSKKEKDFLDFIRGKSYSVSFLKRKFKDITYLLMKLKKKGLIEIKDEFRKIKRREFKESLQPGFYQMELEPMIDSDEKIKINKIINSISEKKFSSFLIFASDEKRLKIYADLIKNAISRGKKVLFILPEIMLIERLNNELNKRINARIGSFHSGLTLRQREIKWLETRENKYDVIIGSRSAIFSPLENIGLIIVDKEEDDSYFLKKDYPFYNLKQAAKFRAEIEKATLVYGSETPSIENYFNAKRNKSLISLIEKEKNNKKILVSYYSKKEKGIIGEVLREKIEKKLRENKQVILFINRKGEEEFLICRNCGYLFRCGKCNRPFNLYKKEKIICYFCNYILSFPLDCPVCKGRDFKRRSNKGTGSVMKELLNLFPEIKVKRFDSEAVKDRKTEYKVIKDFNKGKIEILIGTQLLTYYDFKKVSLIGVLFPENMLGFSDYKGGERFFRVINKLSSFLLNNGEIFIQTSFPENYIIQCLQDFNYIKFYTNELKFRELFGYPPFFKIGEIIFYGKDLRNIANKARKFFSKVKMQSSEVKILEPVLLPRIEGKYRIRILIKAPEEHIIIKTVKTALGEEFKRNFSFTIYA